MANQGWKHVHAAGVQMENLFPKFETIEDVRKAARGGALSGLIFAGMAVLGGAFLFFAGEIPGDSDSYVGDERTYALVGVGIEIFLILLFSWRLSTGKGYVSGILLLALFLVEIATKLLGGGGAVFWVLFYLVLARGILNGTRACFAYKRVSSASISLDAF